MRIKKRTLAVVLTAALTFSLAGCGNNNGNATGTGSEITSENATGGNSGSADLKEVRIAIPAADASSIVENAGIARKLGYLDEELEKAGYTAVFSGFGQGGTAINEAISSKQIDVAFEGDIPPIIGVSNGLNIELFASLNSEAEMGVIVGKDSGIKSVQDLKGKKIVAAFGTVTYIYLIKLLEANNMSVDDVEVINDIANGATLVTSGDADAVISTGMGVYQFQNAGIGKILTTSSEDTSLSAQFFAVGDKDFLSENEDAAKAIIRALIRSKDYITENPDKTYETLADETYTKELWKQIYPEDAGFDRFETYLADSTRDKFNKTSEILKESETIKNDVTADDLYDNTYTTAVYEELGLEIPE